jgi:hypothetical protein
MREEMKQREEREGKPDSSNEIRITVDEFIFLSWELVKRQF